MVPAVAEMSSNSLIIGFSSSNQKRFHLSGTICKVAFTETAGTTSNFYSPLEMKMSFVVATSGLQSCSRLDLAPSNSWSWLNLARAGR